MELRPELMPPALEQAKIARLAKLAGRIDGARLGQWENELTEFNLLAGVELKFEDFQGIYGAEDHDDYVRRLLIRRAVRPVHGVTKEELTEVVRRAMPGSGHLDYEAYMAIFDANVPFPRASNLIFFPFDPVTKTWDDGQQIGEYDPTPEQIVDQAFKFKPNIIILPPPSVA